MEARPVKIVKLKFAELEFYEFYVVSTLIDDIVIDQNYVDELTTCCLEFYGNQRFAYISNRKANYNVNPTIYLNLNKIKLLLGIAVVSEKPSSIMMANFERKFSTLPFEVFFELGDAVEWVRELGKNKKADL